MMAGNRMGLVQAAQQLGSYGRGPDRQLAHISPNEAEFLDYMQGGRRENPHTGLPEYSLFGKILKAVARVAATVGAFVISGGNPLAAAAANGAVTKLTGGSWKDSLKSAAITGVTAGIGNYATGPSLWSNSALSSAGASGAGASGIGLSGVPAASGSGATVAASPGLYSGLENAGAMASMAPATISSAAAPAASTGLSASLGSTAATTGVASFAPAAASEATQTGLQSALAGVGGTTGVATGLAGIAVPLNPMQPSPTGPSGPPPGFGGNINLNVAPQVRQYQPYTGDYAHYGEPGGAAGWQFFDNVNPKPQFLAGGGAIMETGPEMPMSGLSGIGEAHPMTMPPAAMQTGVPPGMMPMMRHYAVGGGVGGPRSPGGGLMGLGALRNPGIPSQIQSPSVPDTAYPRALARDMSPMAQRDDIRRAAIMGYMNAKGGGAIKGPGTGTSDSIPAMLSDGEHVVDAQTISLMGGGSNARGQKAMERMKQRVRHGAGVKNPKKPPAFQGAA